MGEAGVGRHNTFQAALAALSKAWPTSDVARAVAPYLQLVVDGTGGLDTDAVPLALAATARLAFAVVDQSGAIRASDAAFSALGLSDTGSSSMTHLLTSVGRGEPALGLVETRSGGIVAVCAAEGVNASTWPLTASLRSALKRNSALIAVMAFAPTGASDLALSAIAIFGLSELEARIAVALLEAPTLEIAANRVGVGRETARDALAGAMRKVGVRRTPLLVRRLTDLICGDVLSPEGDPLIEAIGLTVSEARVTRLAAEGGSVASVATALGLKPATVKSHLHAAFGKAGVTRAKDLGRLDVELRSLRTLSRAQEIVPES